MKGRTIRIYNIVNAKEENLNIEEIQTYSEQVGKIEEELAEINGEIIQIVEQYEEAGNEQIYDEIQTRIEAIKITLAECRNKLQPSTSYAIDTSEKPLFHLRRIF